jgi:outer membrane protein TolC
MRGFYISYRNRSSRTKRSAVVFAICVGLLLPAVGQAETLTLDRALDIAMERSSDMIYARNNLEISRQNLKAEDASLKSQISFNLTPIQISKDRVDDELFGLYTVESKSSLASLFVRQRVKWTDANLTLSNRLDWLEQTAEREFAGTTINTRYRNTLGFTLSQPLFTYNRTKQALEELKLGLEEAELNYITRELSLEQTVTAWFYNVYQAKRRLEISSEDYGNKEESYNIIKNKVEAGISAQEELLQAEINFAQSKASVEDGQVAYENALDDFKVLLGLSLDSAIEVAADVTKLVVDVDLDKAVQSGLKYAPRLRGAEISIEYAKNALVRTGAVDEFSATVDLSYGLTGTDEDFEDLYKSPLKNQGVAVQLSIPIWDWGKKKSRLKASSLQIEDRIQSKKDIEYQVILGVRRAYRALQNQVTQIDIAEKNVENARLTYEINLERYKNGDISSRIIGEYQNQLANQQLGYISALINYRIELLNLKIASLWDFENNRPALDID